MSVEPLERLMDKIVAQYNRNPSGWSVFADKKGNVLVLSPRSAYRLRIIPLNPQECTGVGVQVTAPANLRAGLSGFPPYGFRPLSKADIKQLHEAVNRFGAIPNALMMRLLGIKTVPTNRLDELRPRGVLSGPVAVIPSVSNVVEGQEELERKLEMEAYKLFKHRYPSRAMLYG